MTVNQQRTERQRVKGIEPMTTSMWRAGVNRSFSADKRGSVAIVVSFVALALILMFTFANETTSAVAAHARLRQAADTAAMAAVRRAAIDTSTDANASLAPAIAEGKARFVAQASSIPRVSQTVPVVTVTKTGLTIYANVVFDAQYSTQIASYMGNLGSAVSFGLGGTSAAQQQVGAHLDLRVLMDTSNSMTIGSTPAAQAALQQDTTRYPIHTVGRHQNGNFNWIDGTWVNCAFACHVTLRDGWGQQYNDYYNMASRLGVQLRIDLLRAAAAQVATAMATSQNAQNFRYSLNTFDRVQRVVYPLGNPSSAGSSIAGVNVTPIDIYGNNVNADYTQTNVAASITAFTNTIGQAGDGSSTATAEVDVVLMTDGVEDLNGNGRETGSFDPTACNALKAKGIRVFVLHAVSQDNFVADGGKNPATIFAALVASMKQCATSPGDYFLASSPADVLAATTQIINLALAGHAILTGQVSGK